MCGKSVKTDHGISRTYQIKTQLGSGGSGAVYMAWHKRLRKHVVIKTVKHNSSGTLELRRNEVEALKDIKSMHVPQVFDFLTGVDHSFTIMEYIDGVSFDKLLYCGRRFTEEQLLKWYSQLSSALGAIHKRNIFHRDIKPANIILTIYGDVCLIDFNSALVSGNYTGVVSRSMGYASPEQLEYFKLCKNSYSNAVKAYSERIETVLKTGDCKTELVVAENTSSCIRFINIDWGLSDIYSLGATMYHLMTGKRPLVTAGGAFQKFKFCGYSEGLQGVIERSMRKTPSERFSSAIELSCALYHLMKRR